MSLLVGYPQGISCIPTPKTNMTPEHGCHFGANFRPILANRDRAAGGQIVRSLKVARVKNTKADYCETLVSQRMLSNGWMFTIFFWYELINQQNRNIPTNFQKISPFRVVKSYLFRAMPWVRKVPWDFGGHANQGSPAHLSHYIKSVPGKHGTKNTEKKAGSSGLLHPEGYW